MSAKVNPLAGKTVEPSMLVERAAAGDGLFRRQARPGGRRRSAWRSAPRAIAARPSTTPSTRRISWRSARRSAITASAAGIDGPLFIGIDTHALAEPALASALEVFAANGVEMMIDEHDGYTPTPVDLARHPDLQQGPQQRAGRRRRHHAVAQSARGWRLQIQSAQWRSGRHRRHRLDRARRQRACSRTTCDGVKRIPYDRARKSACVHRHDYIDALCRRPRQCRRHGGDPRRPA